LPPPPVGFRKNGVTAPEITPFDWTRFSPRERAVLCFIVEGGQVLLILKKRGLGGGKINAPGGKIEPGEAAWEAAIRESQEEVGLTPHDPEPRGVICFEFTDGYSLHCTVFIARGCSGTPVETDEARPFWNPLTTIPYDEMWEDDRIWLPLLMRGETFCGYFHFDGETMLSHELRTGVRVDPVSGTASLP